jgi:tetratricopeptide (TPR) repeat protein
MPTAIEPQTFVSVVRPLLESNDIAGLTHALKLRWNCGQITRLATQGDHDARKVALLCLAMVGDGKCIDAIVSQLKEPDATINQMAEHALWSIWCRNGSPEANTELCRGSQAMNARQLDRAVEHFDRAIEIDPNFSEAFNQRALARFMQDEFEASIADCRKVVRLMPCHFGAWAGMGHCFLHLGQLDHALRAYDRAIAINPHLNCVQQTITEIRRRLGV